MSKNKSGKGIFGLFSAPFAGDAVKGKLLCYDWRIDGEPAEFGADVLLFEVAPIKSHPMLGLVGCSSVDESGAAALTPAAMKEALAFLKKCVKALEVIVAGYIETKASVQFYVYLRSEDDYERMKALSREQKGMDGLDFSICLHSDPDWEEYRTVLYPDEAKMQTVRNGEIIADLIKNGDSDTPRRLNFLLAFPTESDCAAFTAAALDEGFATGEYKDVADGELPCGVTVHRICAMKKWDVDAVTVHAIRLAEEYGGKLLYWDCPIVPRRI